MLGFGSMMDKFQTVLVLRDPGLITFWKIKGVLFLLLALYILALLAYWIVFILKVLLVLIVLFILKVLLILIALLICFRILSLDMQLIWIAGAILNVLWIFKGIGGGLDGWINRQWGFLVKCLIDLDRIQSKETAILLFFRIIRIKRLQFTEGFIALWVMIFWLR